MPNQPLKTPNSRVFLIEGRANPATAPSYESCFRMTAISQGFGDITSVECPDPYQYGKFVEIAQIRGASERATTSLEGRYFMDVLSTMLRLARQNCAVDVQLHMGACQNPSDFNTFTKALILEDALITNFGTEDLGALSSDNAAAVNETIDISASNVYEVMPLAFTTKADSVVTNEIIDLVYGDQVSCAGDDCTNTSDGATYMFAVSITAGGSPSTPADVIMVAGSTNVVRDIDTLTADDPTGIAVVGNYIVVTSGTDASFHYALKSAWVNDTAASWTRVALDGSAYDISSVGNLAFIVGVNGYIWSINSPTGTVTTLQNGSLTTSALRCVHALDSNYVIVGGDTNHVLYSTDGENFSLTSSNPGEAVATVNSVFMQDKSNWWAGLSDGTLWYTKNSGVSWTKKTFSGQGSGSVEAIVFATRSVGFMSHTTAGGVGRLFRTYDGGYTWNLLPDGSGTMPTNQRLNAIASTWINPNRVFAGGLGSGSDGVIVYGSA